MAIAAQPRSVSDATRFTPTTPHATRRADAPAASARASGSAAAAGGRAPGGSAQPTASRFGTPSGGAAGGAGGGRGDGRAPPPPPPPGGPRGPRGPAGSPPPAGETPAQKVARLRAAHLAAKNAKVSLFDRIVGNSRRFFDRTHLVGIYGLVGFTAVAFVLTAYTSVDMLKYNRKRKEEFFAIQRQLEDDSLAAARLAFMRGDATPEQTEMVEEELEREARGESQGSDGFFKKMPSILGAPKVIEEEKRGKTETKSTIAEAAKAAATTTTTSAAASTPTSSWFSSTLAKEEEGDTPGTSQRRLGYESLSEEDDAQGVPESDVVRALEDKQSYLASQARAAIEREKTNQKEGGPLDRIGLDQASKAAATDKSWWKFW